MQSWYFTEKGAKNVSFNAFTFKSTYEKKNCEILSCQQAQSFYGSWFYDEVVK